MISIGSSCARSDRPDVLSSLLADVAGVEPWRTEAILHAIATEDGWEATSVLAGLALAAAERWTEVEEAMERWRDLGVAATRADVFGVYVNAMEEATPVSVASRSRTTSLTRPVRWPRQGKPSHERPRPGSRPPFDPACAQFDPERPRESEERRREVARPTASWRECDLVDLLSSCRRS